MRKAPVTTLNNGVEMPLLGFGVYQMDDPAECEAAVAEALRVGYRLIDTAAAYENEHAVGRAIAQSGIPRDEIFVTTKLWVQDAGYDATKAAFQRSIDRLQLDYLDLYLIHQPYSDVHGSWRAMEDLYYAEKIRAIGISNFQPDRVMDIMSFNRITPAVNQIETHPFHQRVEEEKFLIENGVQMQSWGPFAEGRNNLFSNITLKEIAEARDRTVAQVVLKWLLQRNIVAIPKSVRPGRIAENFASFGFDLSDEEMATIATIDTGESAFIDHRDPEAVKGIAAWKFDT
ncbi:aldo/keto reductase [Paracoccus aerodenitrificans]|uniref:aldo/keto reductase n=1 Tax=Paracoccus aerodenitrificans TaxID=3017781 RepID=UPI0022F06BEA|nr:aldo/keto reductase [Paracoccus aerodenitrificans]WBU64276.1 aldo/keto reductase [Paracoccus aerodenitrificans]